MHGGKLKVPWAVQKATLWVQGLTWEDQKLLASLTPPAHLGPEDVTVGTKKKRAPGRLITPLHPEL